MLSKQEHRRRLETILDQADAGRPPGPDEICFLLSLSETEDLEILFSRARRLRQLWFGDKVFLYGFIYFSTSCRNDCTFCHYRKSNSALKRYSKTPAEVLETALALAAAGVHLIDLTMGESPEWLEQGAKKSCSLAQLVSSVKRNCGLPVMASPGVASQSVLDDLAEAGADWYACYQETHNRDLFAQLRPAQDFDERMGAKISAHAKGMLIEEGCLLGVGESVRDVADSIEAMRGVGADQVRVMTFVPQEGTPMANYLPQSSTAEMATIAVLRLAFPDRLIPASLDVGGLAGLKMRLDAGANVVTSLVVPGRGLAGVANKVLDIEHARRTPRAVRAVLEDCGLEAAAPDRYREWVPNRRRRPGRLDALQGLAPGRKPVCADRVNP